MTRGRDIALALVLAAAITGCFIRGASGRRATGTCTGACDYYLSCKRSDDPAARAQCLQECPDVFSDAKSLMEFEGLSCKDAVEYVDGTGPRVSRAR